MSHEVHQFSFERYLRKKMSATERSEFEHKLQTDSEFNASFLAYKSLRKHHLKELMADYDQEFKAGNRNSIYVYTLLTLLIAGVSVILYYDNKMLRQQLFEIYRATSRRIYQPTATGNIPPEPETKRQPTATAEPITEEETEQAKPSDESLKTDKLKLDTLWIIRKIHTDVGDTLIADEAQRACAVSFWESPIGFEGYRFFNDRLQLFGIDSIQYLMLEEEKNNLWLYYKTMKVRLETDNNFHKFTVE